MELSTADGPTGFRTSQAGVNSIDTVTPGVEIVGRKIIVGGLIGIGFSGCVYRRYNLKVKCL